MVVKEPRSALVVAVPEAAPVIDPWLERTATAKPSRGVPAHATILFPFVPAGAIDDVLLEDLAAIFARFSTFEFALRRTARFPEVLYLAPEPPERFVSLTATVVASFPDYPPYGGAFDSVVPHVTAAEGHSHVLAEAEANIAPMLPIAAEASDVLLLEEIEPDLGRWRTRAVIPLARP